MEATNSKKVRPFGNKDKWLYALGDFGCNMSFAMKNWITLFYTLYIGLDPILMGVIILLLNIWDGINDPIVGALVDRIKPGKNGKFKPWIFWGAIALIVSGAMVFLPIAEADTWVQIVVCILGYLAWDMAYTVVNVPYGSMASVITIDPTERASLSKFRTIGAMLAQLPIQIIVPMIFYNEFVNDAGEKVLNVNGPGVFILTIILGIIGFIAFAVMVKYTVERVQPEQKATAEKVSYLEVIKSFGKNRGAIGLTIASFFSLIMMQGLTQATSVMYTSYFTEIPGLADNSGTIGMISYLPVLGGIFLANPIIKKFGKKNASSFPLLAGVVAGLLMAVLPFGRGIPGLVLWLVLNMIVSCSVAIFSLVGWAMIADCIDYQELQTGRREEGSVYAIYSLGRKVAQGLGAFIVLAIMGLIGFVSSEGDETIIQVFEVANNVRIMIGLIYVVCCAAQFIALHFIYNLGKKEVENMQIALGRINEVNVYAQEDDYY